MPKKCNANTVAAYFLMCQQMENKGVFAEFTESDYEKMIDYSLRKFKEFKVNYDEYRDRVGTFNKAFPVNIISKHPIASMEYNELKDAVDIGDGVTSVISQYDLETEVEQFEYDRTGSGGKIDNSIVGYKLGKDGIIHDIIDRPDGVYPFVRKMTFNTTDFNILFNHDNKRYYEEFYLSVMSELIEYKEKENIELLRDALQSENFLSEMKISSINWITKMGEEKHKDSFIEDDIETSVTLGGHPIVSYAIREDSIADTYRKLSTFMAKEFLERKEVKELLSRFISGKYEDASAQWEQSLDGVIENAYNSTLKDLLHTRLTEHYEHHSNRILSIFEHLQKGRITDLESSLSYWLGMLGESNSETIEMFFKNQKKENLHIEIDMSKKTPSNTINTIPIAKGKMIRRSRVELFNEIIDGLDTMTKEPIPISLYSFKIQLNKKTSSIEIKNIDESYKGKVLPQYTRNDTKGMQKIDTARAIENGELDFSTIVLDEADAAANGNLAFAIRSLAAKAKNIVVATGTPIAGKAKYIVPMLAYSGNMRGEDVERNAAEFMAQCGIYEMKSKLLAKMLASVSNGQYCSGIESFYDKYRGEKASKNSNLFKVVEDGVRQYVVGGLIETGLADKKDFEDLELGAEVSTFATMMESILEKEENGAVSSSFYNTLLTAISGNFRLIKEVPGLNSVASFTTLVKSFGGSQTIISRAGIMGRKETLQIRDQIKYGRYMTEGFSDMEEYISQNNGGARVVQTAIRGYAVASFAVHVEAFMKKNFNYFITGLVDKNVKSMNLQSIVEILKNKYPDEEFSSDYIFTSMQSTSSSKSDNFQGIYKEYLLNNGDLGRTTTEQMSEDKKREAVFSLFLDMYDAFLNEGIKALREFESKSESNMAIRIDEKPINVSRCNYYMPEAFKRIDEDLSTEEVLNSVNRGFPENWVFSVDIDICPVEYRYLMNPDDNGKYIPYRLVFTREEDIGDFLDIMATRKGVEAEIGESIKKRESMALASSRVIGTMLNLLASLNQNLKSDISDRKVIVLNLPAGSSGGLSFGNVIDQLKEEYKNGSRGVLLDAVPRSSMEKAMNAHIDSGSHVTLITNYRSAARGLSLAPIDVMHITGATTMAADALQFRERQYSNIRTSAEITAYGGGGVVAVRGSRQEEMELVDALFTGDDIATLGNKIEQALCDDEKTESLLMSFDNPIFLDTSITRSSNNTNIAHGVGKRFMDGKKSTIQSARKDITGKEIGGGVGIKLTKAYEHIIKNNTEKPLPQEKVAGNQYSR